MRSDQIERLHLTDLMIWPGGDDPFTNENVLTACAELTVGLLVQYSILIPVVHNEAEVTVDYPVVRFTGPRNQLEELLNRYHGVEGAFDPAPFNPDSFNTRDPGFIGTDPTGYNWNTGRGVAVALQCSECGEWTPEGATQRSHFGECSRR